jgi:hypothetical protein
MHEIFISYRQDDSAAWAVILRDALVARFGADRVYLDKDTLHAGDWKAQIQAVLASSKVVLVPIGPRWLDARTKAGQRRLDMPEDIHRWEIAQALAMPGTTVIPVLVDRAAMPSAADLTDDLRALVDRQWRELAHDAARRAVDIERLVADIEGAARLFAHRRRPSRSTWMERLGLLLGAFVVTLVALVVVDVTLEMQELRFGEKVGVFLLILALVALGRRVVRLVRRET